MLETSKLIDGQQAKELDRMCEQYNDASVIIADNTKLKTEAGNFIKSTCSDMCTVYETSNYVITIGQTGEREMVDLKELREYKKLYNDLVELGLVKKVKSVPKIGSIKRKGKRV